MVDQPVAPDCPTNDTPICDFCGGDLENGASALMQSPYTNACICDRCVKRLSVRLFNVQWTSDLKVQSTRH